MLNKEKDKKIQLVKPLMPPRKAFISALEEIWDSGFITNGGPFEAQFEKALCAYLDVEYLSLISSGTLALTLALKALNLKGEVITTPFTSVATAQAIYWNNLKPVFVDIDESTLNIDPEQIEQAIGPETAAILPVHVFGNPCPIERIKEIGDTHGLKVIYDAAHCFGMQYKGRSICNFGDLSVLSFHATKVFNSIEGGAVICPNKKIKDRLDAMKNTGLNPQRGIDGYGLNAKLNEFQSAFGLLQIPLVAEAIEKRKAVAQKYRALLKGISGLKMFDVAGEVQSNYPFFPLLIDATSFGANRDELYDYLQKNNIISRKYFYPLVSDFQEFKMYEKYRLTKAGKIADRILCIPLSHEMSEEEINKVAQSIIKLQIESSGR